jgi:hypothetical protein
MAKSRVTRQNAPVEAQTKETWGASFLAETRHLSEVGWQIRGAYAASDCHHGPRSIPEAEKFSS